MLPSWLLEVVSLIALESQWLEVGRWHDIFRLKWALFWGHVNICGGIWNVPCVHEFVPLDFKVRVLFTRSRVDGPVTRERERENLCKFERPQKMIKSLQSDVTGRIIATLTGPNLTPKGSLVWILFQSGLLIWFQIERFSIHFCSENVGACTDPWIPCRLVACWRKVWICPSTCPRWELVLIYKGFENLEVFFVVSDG